MRNFKAKGDPFLVNRLVIKNKNPEDKDIFLRYDPYDSHFVGWYFNKSLTTKTIIREDKKEKGYTLD